MDGCVGYDCVFLLVSVWSDEGREILLKIFPLLVFTCDGSIHELKPARAAAVVQIISRDGDL